MNRHMMLHLVQAIRANGPCCFWAIFGVERFWKHLTDWMTQKSHPEAVMFNAHNSFKSACTALPHTGEALLQDEEDHILEGHGCQASNIFYHKLITFDRLTNELILPDFLQAADRVSVTLFDSKGSETFGFGQRPDKHQWQAELHRFYCQFPEKCIVCTCCDQPQGYDQLSLRFLQATGSSNHNKQQLPLALVDWFKWRKQQPDLRAHTQQLCYGPKCVAYVFDRATIGGATFSTMATEGKKFSHDSVVIMKDDGVYWAGQVRFFLSHMPPGGIVGSDAEIDIAHVHWYGNVPQCEAMSPTLNCPVFLKAFKDDQSGNMWPVDQLAPCKLGAVQHRT